MHLTVPNFGMSPHPKDGNMYKGFFCKHKTLNETVALQCSAFLFYIIRLCVKDQSTCIKSPMIVFVYLQQASLIAVTLTVLHTTTTWRKVRDIDLYTQAYHAHGFLFTGPVHRFEVDLTYSRQM